MKKLEKKSSHNSNWEPIEFAGQTYCGPYALYRACASSELSANTVMSRLKRLRQRDILNENTIFDALNLSAAEYKAKYGKRKTRVPIVPSDLSSSDQTPSQNMIDSLHDYYRQKCLTETPTVSYSTFRRRVLRTQSLNTPENMAPSAVTEGHLEDAFTLSQNDWVSFYGGGKCRSFTYRGEAVPELYGHVFHSIAAFLKTISRYQDRHLIWNRLKSGWQLDTALTEPVNTEYKLGYGCVYLIELTEAAREEICNAPSLLMRVTHNTTLFSGNADSLCSVGRGDEHLSVSLDDQKVLNELVDREITRLRYVGLTQNSPEARFRMHKHAARKGSSTLLSEALRHYGEDAFQISVIESDLPSESVLGQREIHWIAKLDTQHPAGLNVLSGGGVGCSRGKPTVVEGRAFPSVRQAARSIARERNLAVHVVEAAIREGRNIPEKARRHSKHPKAGTPLFRQHLQLIRKNADNGMVSPRWLSFDNFDSDMAKIPKPSEQKTKFVRIDDSLLWGPDNVEWMSGASTVAKTHGKPLQIGDESFPSETEAARHYGLAPSTLKYRLNKRGMSPEQAVGLDEAPEVKSE
ncbi:hypothetical protein QNS24_003328 [Vibrio parahaemolyticus]|nr:hypothetical protein [Vibrio parahaemolyticus]